MPPQVGTTNNVSSSGQIAIIVRQVSQDAASNTSQVEVFGAINNIGSTYVSHNAKDITTSITGSYTASGPLWGIGPPPFPPGGHLAFVDSTFTIPHDSDGNKTVSFSIQYGNTGTVEFGANKSIGVSLTLDRIIRRPGTPSAPTFSDIQSSSLLVSWDAPSTDGGDPIVAYVVRRYNGYTPTGSHTDVLLPPTPTSYYVNSGVSSGRAYTFTIFAKNNAADNSGWSNESPPTTVVLLAGARVRNSGTWKTSVPYVRDGGIWKMAVPYVRTGGLWKISD